MEKSSPVRKPKVSEIDQNLFESRYKSDKISSRAVKLKNKKNTHTMLKIFSLMIVVINEEKFFLRILNNILKKNCLTKLN